MQNLVVKLSHVVVLQRTAKKCAKIYKGCAIVLLIKPLAWCRSRRCRRRGWLKFPVL